jgi:4-amino-4-deoxy-L-arabinose transferase-like glycosyltransferase
LRLSLLPTLTLLFVGLFTLAYFLLTHEGIYDFDDYTYARYAYQLVTGTYVPVLPPSHPDHIPLHNRLLVFGPVALFYWLGGVNGISTTLWPLLCTIGTTGLIYVAYRRQAPVAASVAMLLLGLHYFVLNLSNYLYPDNVQLFFAMASAMALLVGRRQGQTLVAFWGSGFALFNFGALLSKESIIYYLPFYLVVLVRDLWLRRHSRFWAAAITVGAILLVAYGGYYYYFAGNAFYPFQVVEHTNERLKHHSYALGRPDLLARLTWQPLVMLVGTGLGIVSLLAGQAARQWRQPTQPEVRFWLALAVSSLAFYWLGSTSLTYYNPNSLLPRMLSPVLPPLCMAAGFGAEHYWQTGRGGAWLAGGIFACAAWLHNSLSVVYGVVGLFFMAATVLMLWPRRSKWLQPGSPSFALCLVLALGLGLALRPAYFMTKPSRSAHFAQQRLLQQELRGPAGGVVFADHFLLRNYDFSYGFQVPAGLHFLPYAAHDTLASVPGCPTWLLLNRATLTNDELVPSIISYSAEQVLARFPHRTLVAQEGNVELYRVD